ncbi:MAG: ornithine cyclodeaminase family protein, partial [Candidatus Geothermarchaeales archaeon]
MIHGISDIDLHGVDSGRKTFMSILILSEKDVEACISMREVIELVEAGIKALGEGKAIQPGKIYMDIPKYDGFIKPMTAYIETMDVAATKIFSLYKANPPRYNLPSVFSIIELHNPKTGVPKAIMAGGYITAVRTAAASAVAAKYLAKSDSKRVGIIGAGVQGRSHLLALNELFEIEEVKVFDVSEAARKKYVEEMSKLSGAKVTPVGGPREAVEETDVAVVATTANEPLLMKGWVKPGCLIAKIGSFQELDPETLLSVDKLVVDSWEYIAMRVPEAKMLIKE